MNLAGELGFDRTQNAYDNNSKNKCTVTKTNDILICGDFNFTTINWSEGLKEIV
jgi:hypothetical protein